MDAISFVASVGQLAGAGLTISKALYEYASSVSTASRRMNELALDVELTSSVLSHLSDIFAEATVRAFVRPGALQTAKDAISGCSDIFAEMDGLIQEGKRNFGKYLLPFKDAKLQLLNARLASLKSTLQLLLQVLQYASTVNIDTNASQVSLTGSWVMSQFKSLIDEREEAKRNYEQLKAEIGSIKSAFSEPPVQDSSEIDQPVTFEASAVDTLKVVLDPPQSASQQPTAPIQATASSTTIGQRAADPREAPKDPIQILVPTPTQSPPVTNRAANGLSKCAELFADCLRAIFCCHCRARRSRDVEAKPSHDHHPSLSTNEPRYAPYDTLDRYGPVGVFELGTAELPQPMELQRGSRI